MNDENKDEWEHSTSLDQVECRVNELIALFPTRIRASQVSGLSRSQINRYLSHGATYSFEPLALMAIDRGVSLDWLATGKGNMMLSAAGRVADDSAIYDRDPDDYCFIPLYDVEAAAGHGSLADNEAITSHLAFKKSFINADLRASERDLALITVKGDSMDPTLKSGDTIMINQALVDDRLQDGLYVLNIDGSLLVKRLQALPGDRVRISSDNPAYEPFEVSRVDLAAAGAGSLVGIIGKVVWTGRRI